jgi:hypothetical protein
MAMPPRSFMSRASSGLSNRFTSMSPIMASSPLFLADTPHLGSPRG